MNSKTASKKNQALTASPAIIALAAVLLVALMGWLYYVNFAPHLYPTLQKPGTQERIDWINAKARETHGDYSKLSPEDRQLLEEKTGNHGAQSLGMAWLFLSQGTNTH